MGFLLLEGGGDPLEGFRFRTKTNPRFEGSSLLQGDEWSSAKIRSDGVRRT